MKQEGLRALPNMKSTRKKHEKVADREVTFFKKNTFLVYVKYPIFVL